MIGIQGKDIDYSKADPSTWCSSWMCRAPWEIRINCRLLKKPVQTIDQLSEKDRIAIVVYAGAAGLVPPSTPANDKIAIKESTGQPAGRRLHCRRTRNRTGLQTAADNLIRNGNNRVILCTDGDFQCGRFQRCRDGPPH